MAKRAPSGDISTYERIEFRGAGATHDVYRKGQGPAVIVISEMPNITPRVLGFADRVAALGCSVVLPDLFGNAGRDPFVRGKFSSRLYAVQALAQACISRELSLFAGGKSSPITDYL